MIRLALLTLLLGPAPHIVPPPGGVSSSGYRAIAIGSCSGGADEVMVDNNGIVGCQKISDTAPQGLLIRCQPAYAAGTQTACSTVIAGGQDETKVRIDAADPSVTCPTDTVTVTRYDSNGTVAGPTVLAEGTDWTATASVANTCASLATAINALSLVGATCTSPDVFITLDSNTAVVTLAESDGNCTGATHGTEGNIKIRDGTAALPAIAFLTDPDTGIYRYTANSIGFATNGALAAMLGTSTFNVAAISVSSAAGLNRPLWNTDGFHLDPADKINWSATANVGVASDDVAIERLAVGVLGLDNGNGASPTGVFFQQSGGRAQRTASTTSVDTTLATAGLSITLSAARTYSFRAVLYMANSTAADGIRIDFDQQGDGTPAMTDFRVHCDAQDTVLLAPNEGQVTAITTDITWTATTGAGSLVKVVCEGAMVPSGAAAFGPRFAEEADGGGTLTLQRGSHIWVEDMP